MILVCDHFESWKKLADFSRELMDELELVLTHQYQLRLRMNLFVEIVWPSLIYLNFCWTIDHQSSCQWELVVEALQSDERRWTEIKFITVSGLLLTKHFYGIPASRCTVLHVLQSIPRFYWKWLKYNQSLS